MEVRNDVRPQDPHLAQRHSLLSRRRPLRSPRVLRGYDEYAGRDYSHRKAWVLERLAQLFTIDICAYAVMSNHYHLVLHVDRDRATQLTTEDVVNRWTALFSVPPVIARWQKGVALEAESRLALAIIQRWRERLYDVSWFMH